MDKQTEKLSLRLFSGDKEKLTAMYPGVGYNRVIRHLVSNFIRGVEERAQQKDSGTASLKNINIDQVVEEARNGE